MAKEEGMKIVEVKIGGEALKKAVKNFAPPNPQRPWWSIFLENGNRIYATGNVSVEFETGEPIPAEVMREVANPL